MQNSIKWNSPVILHIKWDSSELEAVTNTREAAHCLMVDWPNARGDAYHRALRTCGLVLCGFVDAEASRTTFLAAARESNVFVLNEIDGPSNGL